MAIIDSVSNRLRLYYVLIKPGIVYGNALTAIAGYLFYGAIDVNSFMGMLIGLMLVMSASCVFNNIIDIDIDREMARTKKRPFISGQVSVREGYWLASVLLATGTVALALLTNLLTVFLSYVGFIAYVFLYGYAKRRTHHSTIIGTISGSMPPVIGYTAASGRLDTTALILFLILVFWQMSHFLSIAIFQRKDYKKANIPLLPIVRGVDETRRQIIIYALLFIISCVALWLFGGASLLWLVAMFLAGGYWLKLCLTNASDIDIWAKRQFRWSLWVLLILCVSLIISGVI